ncbi:MAG: SapC family protein [Caldimicrobium sp.]
MFSLNFSFKNPVILDKDLHRNLAIKEPVNFFFAKETEIIPVGFSQLLEVSMYYPVFFGLVDTNLMPFCALGINKKNVYLNEAGFFRVEVIPQAIQNYPFGIVKKEEEGKEEWVVIVDEACRDDKGKRLFDDNGNETEYLKAVKERLTHLAIDLQKAQDFARELYEARLLQHLPEFNISLKIGTCKLKNILIGNAEGFKNLSPEKLYFYNTIGYIPIFYSIYLSIRNFKLFDLLASANAG